MNSQENNKTEKDYWDRVKPKIGNNVSLGEYYSFVLKNDIRFLLYSLARYKFAAKLIGAEPKKEVLELGCNEGIGTLMLAESANSVMGVDFDANSISWAKSSLEKDGLSFKCDNFLGGKYGSFDAVVSVDVIEHVLPENEKLFFSTILDNLNDDGFCIVGTPNVSASKFASKDSEEGHVNLFSAQRLKELFLQGFKNVFIFGMNDEVVHTGFYEMCHYLFVLACNKK